MNDTLPIIYVSLLLVLLASASWAIFRQILKTRRIENSLSRLEKKLKQEKGTPQEYYELGGIYLDKKLYAQAATLFQKGLKSGEIEDDNAALLYNGLGYAYFAQEQYDLAIRNYKEALKHNPAYVMGLNNLGYAYERKKLTAQALETYEEALKYEPGNLTAKRKAESLRKRFIPSS